MNFGVDQEDYDEHARQYKEFLITTIKETFEEMCRRYSLHLDSYSAKQIKLVLFEYADDLMEAKFKSDLKIQKILSN